MNGDLISREALKEEIGSWGMNDYEPSDFIDAIDNAPTVEQNWRFYYDHGYAQAKRDFERPQGEWIIVDDTEQFIAKCSVCGRIEDSRMVKDYPFCHCGADMRKGGAE